jgi:hypothetical protein
MTSPFDDAIVGDLTVWALNCVLGSVLYVLIPLNPHCSVGRYLSPCCIHGHHSWREEAAFPGLGLGFEQRPAWDQSLCWQQHVTETEYMPRIYKSPEFGNNVKIWPQFEISVNIKKNISWLSNNHSRKWLTSCWRVYGDITDPIKEICVPRRRWQGHLVTLGAAEVVLS